MKGIIHIEEFLIGIKFILLLKLLFLKYYFAYAFLLFER